jgi:hypothetical protein
VEYLGGMLAKWTQASRSIRSTMFLMFVALSVASGCLVILAWTFRSLEGHDYAPAAILAAVVCMLLLLL